MAAGAIATPTFLSEESLRQVRAEGLSVFHDEACVVCGAAVPRNHLGEVREHEYENTTNVAFPVVQCPTCKLTYLHPRPAESELGRIYPKDYYAYHLTTRAAEGVHRKPTLAERILERRSAKMLAARLSSMRFDSPRHGRPVRVLDIGCATGRHLDSLKSILPGCETHGVDMEELAVEIARERGHHAYLGRFEELELPRAHFDLIVSFHVIEHVARPDLFLAGCRELLAPGGRILIETPNTDCLEFRLFKKRHWGGYHPPRHWYMFQEETFRKLGERLDLSIETIGYCGNSPFWVWTCHSALKPWLGRRVADALFPPVKMVFGGLYSVGLLGSFSMLEQVLYTLTGKTNTIWVAFSRRAD